MKRGSEIASRSLRSIDRAVGLLAYVGNAALVALVCVTGVAVFFRYVVRDPIFGINDVSEMVLLTTVACSLAYGGRQGAHVAVDILGMFGGRRITRWTDLIVRVLGIVIVAITVYGLILQGSCGIRCGHFTPDLAIPFKPFYMILAVGLGAYGLVLIAEFAAGIVHFRDHVDPSEKNN